MIYTFLYVHQVTIKVETMIWKIRNKYTIVSNFNMFIKP